MTAGVDPAIADPVGLMVSLVAAVERDLGAQQIGEVVSGVAGGRAKSRQLAIFIRTSPAVLRDGLSPAPRAIADLLIALRNAGARSVSAPRCAQCGKELRTYQRVGQDWYCAVCGPRPERCSACGNLRPVATRDRAGKPRCRQCPDEDGRDPVSLICARVAALQPDADAELVAAAVREVAPRPSHQRRLAWALEDNPALLTGAGHLAPVPALLRLIELLDERGVTGVVRPACPRCHRVVRLSKPLGGERVCRNCMAKARAQPCARCGALREPATRDGHGRPLCPSCLVADPANLESCVNCGRRRPVSTRTADGPLCAACPPLPLATCSICHESGPCGTSRLTGRPWCPSCQRRSARCSNCGHVKQIWSGTLEEPRCEACTSPAYRPLCPACAGRPRPGRCPACQLDRRLRELLAADGLVHPGLGPLHKALAATEPPTTALRWLGRSVVSGFLADVATGRRQLSHQELDRLPQGQALHHLRAVLVSTGALPARDENMARLERLLGGLLASREGPAERQLLHRYAVWHLLRRLRRRSNGQAITHGQLRAVGQQVRAAVSLLDWLSAEDLTLATCRQGDLERWLSRAEGVNHYHSGNFVRWAARQRLTGLVFPATRWQGPTSVLDGQARWEAARRLLHDEALSTRDRFAGLLVLLYAQKTTVVCRLTHDCLDTGGGKVRLRLGKVPITLPGQVADLALELTADQAGHATVGAAGPSPWLFPGGQPGRPISAGHLQQRLKALGVNPRQARGTALFELAAELPAALLARMLGIDISAAVAWQRISSGDWTTYAAEVSRRPRAALEGHEPQGPRGPDRLAVLASGPSGRPELVPTPHRTLGTGTPLDLPADEPANQQGGNDR